MEIGARNVNGSVKPIFLQHGCNEYVGIDLFPGQNVDIIMDGLNAVENFGEESFDVVVATEVLEHVEKWQEFIANMKVVCKQGGIIYLTTRSHGYPPHDFPGDYWRFEVEDIYTMFVDFTVECVEKDTLSPGVFVKARKMEKDDGISISNLEIEGTVKT